MEEINSIRSQISHPIYLDENTESPTDVLRAIALGVCDGFGLKITRLGGLNAFATVRDICAMRSMPHTCEDTWGGDITAAAILHAAVTVTPRLLEAVWIPDNYIEEHYDPINGIQVISGQVELPKGDGLGITPDENQFGSPVFSFS